MIGCGIVGNSLAYHLTDQGWTDVVLIDKGPLPNPGGSTGHASNFIFPVDHSKEMTQLTLESVRQYEEMGVFTECGGIEVARTEERMEELRRRMASAKAWGIEPVSLVTPGGGEGARPVHRRVGDPRRLLHAVRRRRRLAARRHDHARARPGVRARCPVFANTEVIGIDVEGGRVRARPHDHGRHRGGDRRDRVRRLEPEARADGGRLDPAHAGRPPDDRHRAGAAVRADAKGDIEFPIVRDMDTNMYERQDGVGLEIGSYAHRAILHDPEEIPSVEEAALSPTEFPFTQEDFDLQMEQALELMPEIVGDERVGIKYAINGILSLTPDGMPILGETPEVKGLWSAAAVWVKEGPGVGKSLAEWMVHGESEIDLHSSDIARFCEHQKTRDAREGAHRRGRSTRRTASSIPPSSGRRTATSGCSPYPRAASRSSARSSSRRPGWERPQWYESNAPLLEEYGDRVGRREAEWDARWWSPIINAEHLAMRDRAGIFDLSAFAIFDVTGPGALDALQQVSMRQMDVAVGRVVYTPCAHARAAASSPTSRSCGSATSTSASSPAARTAWPTASGSPTTCPADGTAQLADLTSGVDDARALGPARPRHPRER